jgi:DNA primase
LASSFYSEDKVSEIRDRASIREVVSDYVALKKAGKNYRGLCPFHSEKTPSFMVNEEKQIFHCFGCGTGGDVFTFLMKIGQFSFPQTVEELARRYAVELPRRELSPGQKKEMAKRDLLFQINQIASDYFHDLLLRKREGEPGRKYLSQRGLAQEVIEEHRLGYAPDRWDGLVQHLREKKASLELAWELGLILPKKREGWYDLFRGRVIFPILDLHQRVVGFGGRLIQEGLPKYINSQESSIYHKGDVLYGLPMAKRFASEKDCAIIVEGYFDLLTLHQYGLRHSVATLGTALTSQHIRHLKRYTHQLITVFDADQAGVQATLRSLPLFLEEEVSGKTIILPGGEDPDTFLRKGELEAFDKMVAEARPLIDFYFDWLMKNHDVRGIEGKVRVAKEGTALIEKIPDGIRRNFYTKALAERLDLQESLLHEMVRTPPKGRPDPETVERPSPAVKAFPKSEEIMVRLMIHRPELIPSISEQGILGDFESPLLRGIAEDLEAFYQRKGRLEVAEALGSLGEDSRKWVSEFALQENGMEGADPEKVLKDCIQRIRQKKLKKDEGELLKRIKEAEKAKGQRELEALLLERQALARRGRQPFRKE